MPHSGGVQFRDVQDAGAAAHQLGHWLRCPHGSHCDKFGSHGFRFVAGDPPREDIALDQAEMVRRLKARVI